MSLIDTIRDLGYPNPINPREIVIDNAVCVEVSEYDDTTIWLKSIRSLNPGNGDGTRVLRLIMNLAHSQGFRIILDPQPLSVAKPIPMGKLLDWYSRMGFRHWNESPGMLIC